MKLRERWLPLYGTALLVILCTILPFAWFAVRDRQLDSAWWITPAGSSFLSAAGQENAVARELYYWRQQPTNVSLLRPTELPAGSSTAVEAVGPYLTKLRSSHVLPGSFLDAAQRLAAQAPCTITSESTGTTTYSFASPEGGSYLSLTVSDYGILTSLRGNLGLESGFVPAEVVQAYRAMLGLDSFTDWEDAEPLGYGSPVPCYSADAQLYLIANMDRGYFSLSVTSMAPDTYAGL